jgi:beta-ribofuranosylaminobenzene 5'-phosphate synthase
MASESHPAHPTVRAVEVRTPARIHLGMMAFGVPEARSYGGVGFMLDRPGLQVRLKRSPRIEAKGVHAERAVRFAGACLSAWGIADGGCSIEVVSGPRAHVGLGSGTQLALAVAAGVRHLFLQRHDDEEPGIEHPLMFRPEPGEHDVAFETREVLELARAVSRGRRSCVGIHGFSRGGLIIEAGRVAGEPTPATQRTSPFSPMVARVRLPSSWRCLVIVGRDAIGLHGEAERAAFRALPPVPREVTGELARLALLELLPAAVEADFAAFSAAVRAYGRVAGQPFEAESKKLPHAEATSSLIELLGELGVTGAAQSSWGPAVVACCESLEAAGTLLDRLESLGMASHHEMTIARFDDTGAALQVLE